ncbi:MAG: AAA family ATPase [Mesorhizobium sp.]|nr:MAG: AAA family ATPase [Mesorhizobium sp.]
MRTVDLANKYRPTRFSDVLGQPHAVGYLSRLVLCQARPRHLLLCGSHASGKTTLARIYAKALNCSNVAVDGSPCNICAFCTDRDGLFEYDVPGKGGSEDDVAAWLEGRYRTPVDHKTSVLFFDEAHGLSPRTADSLLKRVEESAPGVAFVFATTEPSALRYTLRSRLMRLEVRRLGLSDAVRLLRDVADREGIEYDVDGLALLASIKRGYPRDLLMGLDQVGGLDTAVTVAAVKEMFGLDQTERLVELFLALASGDEGRQLKVLADWPEELSVKIDWIRAFLTSIRYCDILGVDFVGDPITFSIKDGRAAIVEGFCRRLGLQSSIQLLPYWERMLSFWDRSHSVQEADFQLRLALFQDLVNHRLAGSLNHSATPPMRANHFRAAKHDLLAEYHSDRHREYPDADLLGLGQGDDELGDQQSLSLKDVREIVNRASWFTQATGWTMNAAFEIRPLASDIKLATTTTFIADFVRALQVGGPDLPRSTASITVFEASGTGNVIGYVCAHIEGLDDPSRGPRLRRWCDRGDQANGGADGHDVEVSFSNDNKGMRFHWAQVFKLCAGLGGEAFIEDDQGATRALRDIGIRKDWRQPGMLPFRVLYFQGLVGNAAIDAATANGMEFLSAFDDRALGHLTSGWELKEHRDRIKECASRRQQVADLAIYDAERVNAERQRLTAEWATAKARRRHWTGWWRAMP